ncbi:rhodanese-like domain-containing protein [Streptomyces griseoincarnatus]
MFLFRRGTGRLTPEHARTGDGTAVLLDVREAQEWRAGHAPGAVHLSLSRPAAGGRRRPAAGPSRCGPPSAPACWSSRPTPWPRSPPARAPPSPSTGR